MSENINIVWFKKDLRLYDHASLYAAAKNGKLLLLYIIEPRLWSLPDSSFRHWSFIHNSLIDMKQELKKYGANLCIRIGEAIDVFNELKNTLGNFTIYSHMETGNNWTYQRDKEVSVWCSNNQIEWQEFQANGIVRKLRDRKIWSDMRIKYMLAPLILMPEVISSVTNVISDELPDKDHSVFQGYNKVYIVQKGGRKVGLGLLKSFVDNRAKNYMYNIAKPMTSVEYCSRLSPHIAYGTLSVREIEQTIKNKIASLANYQNPEALSFTRHLEAYLSRLAWHCHFIQKFEQQAEIEYKCMHKAFEGMRREPYFNADFFEAWKYGRTGYPIIDACMRSLIHTGWLTFRMRAMVVSFASYHLWLDWRVTAPYLATLFTDYEPGIHYAQFQMQSGVTGINSVRIYNPLKQSYDHDTNGEFIRKYVYELADIPQEYIHEPWKMLFLPNNYPKRLVKHEDAVEHAYKEFKKVRAANNFKEEARKVFAKLGSRKRQDEGRKNSEVREIKEQNHPQLNLNLM